LLRELVLLVKRKERQKSTRDDCVSIFLRRGVVCEPRSLFFNEFGGDFADVADRFES
jgi:hypothetical protein